MRNIMNTQSQRIGVCSGTPRHAPPPPMAYQSQETSANESGSSFLDLHLTMGSSGDEFPLRDFD